MQCGGCSLYAGASQDGTPLLLNPTHETRLRLQQPLLEQQLYADSYVLLD
jgi:hypothetical protein